MTELNVLSAFLVGVAGGVHCVGMCGGVVAALNAVIPPNQNKLPFTLAYNFGRIASYTLAGAITGALGQMATHFVPVGGPILSLLSALMLILLACYLGNWWRGLVHIEALGQKIFRSLQPMSKRFIPFKNPAYAIPYGFIWGWLPCGLVYSTLTWSLAVGNAVDGALLMLAFGLGTLPTLIIASIGSTYLMQGFKHPVVRQVIATGLFMYAIFLIYRAIQSIS